MQYYTEPRVALLVPPGDFVPPPSVESAVLVCRRRSKPPVEVSDVPLFFQVVKAAFSVRRKMLGNALRNIGMGGAEVDAWLSSAGVDRQRRGETLSLAEFARLTNTLTELRAHG
jgi:16S rRNA (adenine1518-N6/adenine1519-N6)-dimethyltransferase